MGHHVPFPDQRQRPGHQDRDQEQHADHTQRKFDVALAVEQNPGREREPGDQANRGPVDGGMKLIEHGLVVGDEFSGHERDLPCVVIWDRVGLALRFVTSWPPRLSSSRIFQRCCLAGQRRP